MPKTRFPAGTNKLGEFLLSIEKLDISDEKGRVARDLDVLLRLGRYFGYLEQDL